MKWKGRLGNRSARRRSRLDRCLVLFSALPPGGTLSFTTFTSLRTAVSIWRNAFAKRSKPPTTNWQKCPAWVPPQKWRQRTHARVRIWRIREFEEYLIAYKPRRGGVAIERIIHAKQDYRRILR